MSSTSSSAARNAATPPPEITTEPTASDQEIARLRERVKELEARLAPPEPRTATNDQPQFSSIVLFGADGNLATKKTFPTLFALWRKKLLPRDIVIIGYAREAMDTETFRKNIVRSRRPAVPSRHRRDSWPSSDEVGGFCFDSEAVRTASRDHDAPRRSTRPSTPRLTPSGNVEDSCSGCTTAAGSSTMLHTCGSASRHYSRSARPRPPMHRVDGVAMTSRESARRRVMMSTQARGEAGPRRLRVGRRAPPAPRRPEPHGVCFVLGR